MHAIYALVAGPLVWIAFLIFFGGLIFRITQLFMMARRKEPFIFSYLSFKFSLRSIFHWILPFGTTNWRLNPILTVVTFVFHFCLLITPFFLLSHMVLLDESLNLNWWTLPDTLADMMTVIVIAGCIYFGIRRKINATVRFVTDSSDYIILGLVAAPFITGFFAYHQWFHYPAMLLLHILSAEILLIAIPFTRLAHMLLAFLTRSYMGSEFGKIRHARDW
ncbi:MAG: nitrate reductase [Desulfobacteraceae bacterium]|jgi:nitrate reductase gamma subunit